MSSVFHLRLVSPVDKQIGVMTNKLKAFETIANIASTNNNSTIIIDDESDKYQEFHRKTFNYINFTRYFKSTLNKTSLVLKIVNNDTQQQNIAAPRIVCTMFELNSIV